MSKSFLKDLLEVCQKHRVNLQGNGYFVTKVGNTRFEVDVNGGWGIKKEYQAASIWVEETPATGKEIALNGTK